MTDEHLMRHWADAHNEFSADLDRGLLRLGRFVGGRLQGRLTPSPAYAPAACTAMPASAPEEAVGRAALAGAMACLATTLLLLTVALLTTAGTHGTAALALVSPAIVA
jgi:hypothetical protein